VSHGGLQMHCELQSGKLLHCSSEPCLLEGVLALLKHANTSCK
jgi:hypothetical protein